MTTVMHAAPYLIRQCRLGTEAVYRVLAEDDQIVTAEVVRAPGLQPGAHVRLLASAARAMERLDPAPQPASVADTIAVPRRVVATGVR